MENSRFWLTYGLLTVGQIGRTVLDMNLTVIEIQEQKQKSLEELTVECVQYFPRTTAAIFDNFELLLSMARNAEDNNPSSGPLSDL